MAVAELKLFLLSRYGKDVNILYVQTTTEQQKRGCTFSLL